MKKKVDKNVLSESCYMMNISKTLTTIDGNTLSNKISDDKLVLQNPLTPPQSVISSPNSKVKSERENSPNATEYGDNHNYGKSSPPLSSLGPGAEIKGKLCHPIPSSSKSEELDPLDESCKPAANLGPSGGRLTFFKEGKLLLELSHRSEQGSWVQVKSKTYWPPPSTTTSSTIQHPLRHDTPTTHSDDCSSVNSSPWSSDHIRKQSGPNPKCKLWVSTDHLFYVKNTPFIRSLRRKVRLRRNPYFKIVGPVNNFIGPVNSFGAEEGRLSYCSSVARDVKYLDRKRRLEKSICHLGKQNDLRLDENLSIRTLFEGRDNSSSSCSSNEGIGPTFITPRKRYLRALEADIDTNSRKKVHAGIMSPASLHLKHCDRLPSPSLHGPHKSAISCQNSSSYSIDSLLSNNESDKKSESFLRNLLRSDKPRHSSQIKQSICKDRSLGLIDGSNHMKVERGASPYPKERKEPINDQKKALPERFDLSQDMSRFSAHSNLGSLYLNPYLDPRYMMLHSLSSAPPFLPPVSQSNDMASAVAVAAAAAAGYTLNPLHISLTANSLLPGGLGGSAYAPATSLASHLIRSPNPNRASPLSVPHSPSPKLSPALPLSPHFGIAGSPREVWTPSTLQNSPHKYPSTSSISPPPQEVPLNLTKPKRK